jgi:DNA repair exonuclease SbcCD ATPase subunit
LARVDDVRSDSAGDALRRAEDVARVTLEEARAAADQIRIEARKQAAKLRAEARADARGFETAVGAMKAEIAALAAQLAALEAERGRLPDPGGRAEIVTGRSLGGQSGSLASSAMFGEVTIEREMDDIEAERIRLEDEIAAAKRRIDAVRLGGSERALAERDLGVLVLAAYDELGAIEREHQATIDSVRDSARAEAARILEAAREQASAVHDRAVHATHVSGQDTEPDGSR